MTSDYPELMRQVAPLLGYDPRRRKCLLVAYGSLYTNELTGISRVLVDEPERWPKQRKMLGVVRVTVAKLAAVTDTLAVAEGVEAALAAPARRTYPCLRAVRAALRAFLRWDTRHDRMAVDVMRRFGLNVPQHRELTGIRERGAERGPKAHINCCAGKGEVHRIEYTPVMPS